MKSKEPCISLPLLGLQLILGAVSVNAQTIYWTDIGSGKIQRADLNGGMGVEDLITTPQVFDPVDVALDLGAAKMYWTESLLADFMISRANLDGSNVELLVTNLLNPSGIELDISAGRMYWCDRGTGKIQRANLDGSVVEDIVVTEAVDPVDIALDLSNGHLFWTEGVTGDFTILRSDLDGANVQYLVTKLDSPSGLALDVGAGKMYWTDIGTGRIQRANLDGSQIEDVIDVSVIEPVRIALDTTAGKIYWTESSPADFMISRANLDGTELEFLITGLSSPSGIALDVGQTGAPVPAVSEWGMLITCLNMLTVGTLILGSRERRTAVVFGPRPGAS